MFEGAFFFICVPSVCDSNLESEREFKSHMLENTHTHTQFMPATEQQIVEQGCYTSCLRVMYIDPLESVKMFLISGVRLIFSNFRSSQSMFATQFTVGPWLFFFFSSNVLVHCLGILCVG